MSVTKTAGKAADIRPATGRLGILTPGMGAVATTFMAGVEAIRRGTSKPIGSLTQMGTIRLGKRTDGRSPLIKEFVPLAKLEDIVFGGWDLFPDDAYLAAKKAGVLSKEHLEPLKDFLSSIRSTSRSSPPRTPRPASRRPISPSRSSTTSRRSRRTTSATGW